MAEDNKDFVMGFITQRNMADDNFIHFTPGKINTTSYIVKS